MSSPSSTAKRKSRRRAARSSKGGAVTVALQITVHYEGGDSISHPLNQETLRIGRRTDNDVVIPDSYVSGYHAELKRLANASYEVEDLDSHNGMTVNGEKVKKARVKEGDVIVFGVLETVIEPQENSRQVVPLKPPPSGRPRQKEGDPLAKTLSHSLSELRKRSQEETEDQLKERDQKIAELQKKVEAAQVEISQLREAETSTEGEEHLDGGSEIPVWRGLLTRVGAARRERKIQVMDSSLAQKTEALNKLKNELSELEEEVQGQRRPEARIGPVKKRL